MNDELPPIPDDPQQSFGSPMEHIERLFSSKAKRATWQLRFPNGRDGKVHVCTDADKALADAAKVLDEGHGVHSVARNGNAIHLRALKFRENQAIAVVKMEGPSTPLGPTGPVGPVGQMGPVE